MPAYSSPSPPIPSRPVDDPRPLPISQAPLATSPSSHKISPVLVPARSTLVPKVDSALPPLTKERAGTSSPSESIDRTVFDQILELDDDDDEIFSKEMVDAYFVQADKTFDSMDAALAKKDLAELSSLGHFLKGSSAALGLSKVQTSCENIQHFGQLREGSAIITEAEAIGKITKSIARAREEYADAKTWLERFYVSYRTKA